MSDPANIQVQSDPNPPQAIEIQLALGTPVYHKDFGIGVVQQVRHAGAGFEYWVKFERSALWFRRGELKVEA